MYRRKFFKTSRITSSPDPANSIWDPLDTVMFKLALLWSTVRRIAFCVLYDWQADIDFF